MPRMIFRISTVGIAPGDGRLWIARRPESPIIYLTKAVTGRHKMASDRPARVNLSRSQLWAGYRVLATYDPEVSDPLAVVREIVEATQQAGEARQIGGPFEFMETSVLCGANAERFA